MGRARRQGGIRWSSIAPGAAFGKELMVAATGSKLVTDLRVRDLEKTTTEELDHVPCTVSDMALNMEVVS